MHTHLTAGIFPSRCILIGAAAVILRRVMHTDASPGCASSSALDLQELQRSFEKSEAVFGSTHPTTLTTLHDICILLLQLGKYDEAESFCRRAIEGHEVAYGQDHPSTLCCVNNLAAVFHAQGKYQEAEANNFNNLAAQVQSKLKYRQAVPLYRRTLQAREAVLGRSHPNYFHSLDNLALVLQDMGECEEAESLYARMLEERTAILGKDHPDTLSSAENLAAIVERWLQPGHSSASG